jgi:hypothetical protein
MIQHPLSHIYQSRGIVFRISKKAKNIYPLKDTLVSAKFSKLVSSHPKESKEDFSVKELPRKHFYFDPDVI